MAPNTKQKLYVTKARSISGKKYEVGDEFLWGKSGIPARKLEQLIKIRILSSIPPDVTKAPAKDEGALDSSSEEPDGKKEVNDEGAPQSSSEDDKAETDDENDDKTEGVSMPDLSKVPAE